MCSFQSHKFCWKLEAPTNIAERPAAVGVVLIPQVAIFWLNEEAPLNMFANDVTSATSHLVPSRGMAALNTVALLNIDFILTTVFVTILSAFLPVKLEAPSNILSIC